MAVKKLDTHPTDARKSVTVKSDPTRIDPLKLKLGKHAAQVQSPSWSLSIMPHGPVTLGARFRAGGGAGRAPVV